MKQIILASGSPRRKKLLEKSGIKFKAVKSKYVEDLTLKLPPKKLVKFLANGKALDVAKKYKKDIIIASDMFILFGNRILGKPRTTRKAIEMLKKINGKTISVINAIVVLDSEKNINKSKIVEVKIKVRKLSNLEIKNYVETGEPLDKSGAFGIQGIGANIIKKIDGDYFAVIGLPIFDLLKILRKLGVKVI